MRASKNESPLEIIGYCVIFWAIVFSGVFIF